MSGGIGVNPKTSHVWSIESGPLGACNAAMAETENLKRSLKWLQDDELGDEHAVLHILAAEYAIRPEDNTCFDQNYLDGAFWPDHENFAHELRVASIDGLTRAIVHDKRLVVVLMQVPGVDRPWVNVIESYTEVHVQLTLPAGPIEPQ